MIILTHLSLFTGIGGLDLAAEQAGFITVGQCERADYPNRILDKHWPGVPRWKDIKSVTAESFRERTGLHTADIISAGYPCQKFSLAGKRTGELDLAREFIRVVGELRPRWALGENVAGHIGNGLDDVLRELGAKAYQTRTFVLQANAVGAQHKRERVIILAHTDTPRQEERNLSAFTNKQGFDNRLCNEELAYTYIQSGEKAGQKHNLSGKSIWTWEGALCSYWRTQPEPDWTVSKSETG